MNSGKSLVSSSCPDGYLGHYTITAQDSLTFLAGLFSITEEDLLQANPQIESADTLESGTKIHIPGLIPFPAGINFALTDKELPFASGGGAFIHISPEGGQSVSVIATLPTPSYFGTFDLYLVEVLVSQNNIFEGQLFSTPDDPPSWAARVDLPFLTSLTPESEVIIRPFNSMTGSSGDLILRIRLGDLPAMNCGTSETLSITSEYDTQDGDTAAVSDFYLIKKSAANKFIDSSFDEGEVFDEIEVLDVNHDNNPQESADSPSEDEVIDETYASEEIGQSLQESVDSLPEEEVFAEAVTSLEEDNSSPQEPVESLPDDEVIDETYVSSEEVDQSLQESVDSLPDEEVFAEAVNIAEENDNSLEEPVDSQPVEEVLAEALTVAEEDDNSWQEPVNSLPDEEVLAEAITVAEEDDSSLQEPVDSLPDEEVSAEAVTIAEEDDNSLQEPADSLAEEEVIAEVVSLVEEDDNSPQELIDSLPEDDSNNLLEQIDSPSTVDANQTSDLKAGFKADHLLQEYSTNRKTAVKYTPYASTRQNRRPINLVLKATFEAEQAIGIASIQLQPSQLIIAALKLPDPASLGQQYKFYKAWLIDAGNSKTAAIEMKKILNGVWVGQSSSSTVKAFDLIFVTAETTQDIKEPAGPEVLIGILAADI